MREEIHRYNSKRKREQLMSKFFNISCTRCGKDLYRPLTISESREKKEVHFPGFYVVNDNGQEELCEKCFEVWKRSRGIKNEQRIS